MIYTEKYRRILHRLGYYDYQHGLIYRHLNQDGGWDRHLELCRNYILKAVDHFKPESVTILGSGWLLDLPLAELVEKTQKVILVDIIHPPAVASQVAGFQKVAIIEDDVTGGLINEVWTKTGKYGFFRKMKSLSEISIPEYIPEFDPGLVISLNLLTQMETLLLDHIKKKSKVKEDELDVFRKEIQEKHLCFLSKFKSVMITDVEEIFTGKNGSVKVIPTLRADIPEGALMEEWTWNFDLKGSDYYNNTSVMKVMAITFGS